MNRDRNRRACSRGRWALERERSRIGDPLPPHEFNDGAPIAGLVAALMGRLQAPGASRLTELAGAWPALVGGAVAAHSRPGRLDGPRLTVYVDNSMWLSELERTWKKTVLARVQEKLGPSVVQSILFRIDPGERAPRPSGAA